MVLNTHPILAPRLSVGRATLTPPLSACLGCTATALLCPRDFIFSIPAKFSRHYFDNTLLLYRCLILIVLHYIYCAYDKFFCTLSQLSQNIVVLMIKKKQLQETVHSTPLLGCFYLLYMFYSNLSRVFCC